MAESTKQAPRSPKFKHGSPFKAGPNVILVVIDTLRADHLSHYGYARDTGAGLDELASHATRFTRAYAPTCWTSPSIASLFTGVHPVRHGVERLGQSLPKKRRTLAEELAAHGWIGIGHSFNHVITRATDFHRGFAVFEEFQARSGQYGDISDMMQRARLWIDHGTRPFFLYLQPMNVHGPYAVPPKRRKALLGHEPSRLFAFQSPLTSKIREGEITLRKDFSAEHVQSLVDQYDTAIRYTTDQLGGMLQQLKKRGLYDDALIVLTADHGEELFDHGGLAHGNSLHEELVRVPLYVKLPGQKAARTVDETVSLVDLFPTIVDALGFAPPKGLDGSSLVPLLHDEGWSRESKQLFVSTLRKGFIGRALSWKGHKLVEIEKNYEGLKDVVRLYDLENDPGERTDLSAKHPEMVAAYREEIARLMEHYGKGRSRSEDGTLTKSEQRHLKALGYAQ